MKVKAMMTTNTGLTRIAYSPLDAAAAIGLSRAQLYVLMARGEIPAFKAGSRTLVKASDLQAFIDRQPRASFNRVLTTPAA
jgi:excisionase family DNA binding protein